MARCPDCSKMVSLENADPEVQNEELNDGAVSFDVRLARNCADCSTELKEYTYSFEGDHLDELRKHLEEKHPDKVPVSQDDSHTNWDLDMFELEVDDFSADESGGGRYKKNMISVRGSYTIKCTLCDPSNNVIVKQEVSDETAASAFDELC